MEAQLSTLEAKVIKLADEARRTGREADWKKAEAADRAWVRLRDTIARVSGARRSPLRARPLARRHGSFARTSQTAFRDLADMQWFNFVTMPPYVPGKAFPSLGPYIKTGARTYASPLAPSLGPKYRHHAHDVDAAVTHAEPYSTHATRNVRNTRGRIR